MLITSCTPPVGEHRWGASYVMQQVSRGERFRRGYAHLPERAAPAYAEAPLMVARTATLPALVFAGGMALLAGATNAYGFVEL